MGCIFTVEAPEIPEINFTDHTFEKTNELSLNNKFMIARVVDIYDGDTITCVINIFNNFYRFNVRLGDIDTCEMKSNNESNKKLAYKARNRLCQLITSDKINLSADEKRKDNRILLNKEVYLVKILCGEFDKYGRLLGWIFHKDYNKDIVKEESYNYTLINEKLAYKYEGNTKLTEIEQINLLEIN